MKTKALFLFFFLLLLLFPAKAFAQTVECRAGDASGGGNTDVKRTGVLITPTYKLFVLHFKQVGRYPEYVGFRALINGKLILEGSVSAAINQATGTPVEEVYGQMDLVKATCGFKGIRERGDLEPGEIRQEDNNQRRNG